MGMDQKGENLSGSDNNEYYNINSNQFFKNRIEREWLSTEEAAHYLSVSANSLRIMVHRGQVKSYKFGRRLRFRVDDCKALFKKRGA